VARGAGLGLVAQRMVRESPHAADLRIVEVNDFQPTLNVWLIRAGDLGPLSAPVDVLAETVRDVLRRTRLVEA